MTRKLTVKIWGNVPGVLYPDEKRFSKVPGVVYPASEGAQTKTEYQKHRATLQREERAAESERIRFGVVAAYDAGKTGREAARKMGISADTAIKILRKAGKPIQMGRIPKGGRDSMTVRAQRVAERRERAARVAALHARVVAAYDALPADTRSGEKVAAAAGIGPRWACKILKAAGRELSSRGRKKEAS